MGFRIKTTSVLVFLCFTYLLNGQEEGLKKIDLAHIYNEWAFSKLESKDGELVYRERGDFFVNNQRYRTRSSLKFVKSDNVFMLRYIKAYSGRHCGYDAGRNILKRTPRWEKGVWEIMESGNFYILELEYLEAEKGRGYLVKSKETYQILHLEEDKMILRELVNDI